MSIRNLSPGIDLEYRWSLFSRVGCRIGLTSSLARILWIVARERDNFYKFYVQIDNKRRDGKTRTNKVSI